MTVDCSDEANDKRRELLDELRNKRFSGVQSISDRSRSVTYLDPLSLAKLIRNLEDELNYCLTGRVSRPRRVFHVPYSKWQ